MPMMQTRRRPGRFAMPKVKVRTRRRFLAGLSGLGAATLLPTPSRAAEGPLETTVVRLARTQDICGAPQYVAKPLLRAEGFTRYPLC